MRPIKFRAFFKGQMLEAPLNTPYGQARLFGFLDANGVNEFDNVMQYTGLKDKNGKEIYEGDIVRRVQKAIDGYVMENITGPVEWHKFWTKFMVPHPKSDSMRDLHFVGYGFIEVIGNIHENPELLV